MPILIITALDTIRTTIASKISAPIAIRLLTACCVVGLCGFATTRGWSIVRFAGAESGVASHEAGIDAIRPWIGAPGLTSTALRTSLTKMANSTDIEDARRRTADLTALLAVRPLSAIDWLSLAGMRLTTAQPTGVLAALTMSSLSGPNEGAVMLQRALFGLLEWEVLPADARQRVSVDLAGAVSGNVAGDGATTLAKNVLRAKLPQARSELAGLLRARGVSADDLARIGL